MSKVLSTLQLGSSASSSRYMLRLLHFVTERTGLHAHARGADVGVAADVHQLPDVSCSATQLRLTHLQAARLRQPGAERLQRTREGRCRGAGV